MNRRIAEMSHLTQTKWSFLVLGSVTMLFGLWWGFRRWNAIVNWPTAAATVLTSVLSEASGVEDPSERMFSNTVHLRFEAAGKSYEVKVNDWGTSNSAARHRAVASRYAVGSQHTIRYNRNRPQDVYLEAGYTFEFFKVTVFCLGLGGLFTALGIFLFCLGRRPA
jgi:hypothetical protein